MLAATAFLGHLHRRKHVVQSTFSSLDDLMNELLLHNNKNSSSSGLHDDNQMEISSHTRKNLWRTIDWKAITKDTDIVDRTPRTTSPVDTIMIGDRIVYIKRDDQLRLAGSQISGNKARKMFTLNAMDADGFPSCLVSYGGPQSNAMLALAAVVHFQNERAQQQPTTAEESPTRKKRFVYYTKKLPRFLRNQPNGNLFRALSLGMELIEVTHDDYRNLFGSDWGGHMDAPPNLDPPVPGNSVWIPQGSACPAAVLGTKLLAEEIVRFWKESGKGRPLSLCVPGGTCSTAAFLHQAIQRLLQEWNENLDVLVCVIPCVGDENYARRQMMNLNHIMGYRAEDIPMILSPSPRDEAAIIVGDEATLESKQPKFFQFGEPDLEIFHTFQEFSDTHGIALDLLYGAPSWTILHRHLTSKRKDLSRSVMGDDHSGASQCARETDPFAGRVLMYVHSGGLEGINSQLLRYQHKGLLTVNEIQVPYRKRTSTSSSPRELRRPNLIQDD